MQWKQEAEILTGIPIEQPEDLKGGDCHASDELHL